MYQPSVKALSGNLAKISILTVLFVTVSTTSANGWFGKNSNKGGGWGNFFGSSNGNNGYDDNDWPEWTPMYWMEEFFGDDDDNYNRGRYRSAPRYANPYGANQPYGRVGGRVDQRPLVSPYANAPYARDPRALAPRRAYAYPQPQGLYGGVTPAPYPAYGASVPRVAPPQYGNRMMMPPVPNRAGGGMPFLGGGRSFGNSFGANNFSHPFSSGGFSSMPTMNSQRGFGGGFPNFGSMNSSPMSMGGFGSPMSSMSPMGGFGSPMSPMSTMSPMGGMGMPGMSPMGGFGSPMSPMSPMGMGTMGMPGMSPMNGFGGSPFSGGSSFMPFR